MLESQVRSNAIEVGVVLRRPTLSIAFRHDDPEDMGFWESWNRVVLLRKFETGEQRYGSRQLWQEVTFGGLNFAEALQRANALTTASAN